LLLDEPTDGLDPVAREMFRSILAEHLADNPTTVIFSTHLVYEVESLADHLGVLRDGELVAQLRTDELKERMKRYITRSENGANRETAKTMWGSPADLRSVLASSGNTVRDIQDITLQEAAVALLSRDER
jgi:ABC-2 type transport system ATP-binding protein